MFEEFSSISYNINKKWGVDLKEIKDSKIRIKRHNKAKGKEDTLGITMELEKSLQIDTEIEKEKKKIKNKIKQKIIKNLLIIFGIVLVASVAGFFVWLSDSYKTTEYASHYMIPTKNVNVETFKNGTIMFSPKKNNKNIGIIIYPSQKIKPMSYSRLSNMLANNGYNVFIPKLKFNFSSLSKGLAEDITRQYGEIKEWYIIGHSTSGDVALSDAANQKDIQGVIFLGTYPSNDVLKLINKPALSIWGTKDGLLNLANFDEYKNNLPQNASFFEIVGGNNSNFADVVTVPGDNEAIVAPLSQQEQTVSKIVEFINNENKDKVKQ